MSRDDQFKNVISHAKEYGFIFQSSEIYDGLGAVYDYGQNGTLLKNNIKEYWWKAMVQLHENIVGIDSAIFAHPTTWKASGHVDAFNDPLIDNKDSKKRYRADVLVEDYVEKLRQKADKEVTKAAKRFGDSFDEKMYRETNPRVLKYAQQGEEVMARFVKALEADDLAEVKQVILDAGIVCPSFHGYFHFSFSLLLVFLFFLSYLSIFSLPSIFFIYLSSKLITVFMNSFVI